MYILSFSPSLRTLASCVLFGRGNFTRSRCGGGLASGKPTEDENDHCLYRNNTVMRKFQEECIVRASDRAACPRRLPGAVGRRRCVRALQAAHPGRDVTSADLSVQKPNRDSGSTHLVCSHVIKPNFHSLVSRLLVRLSKKQEGRDPLLPFVPHLP
jgi:hypothetical protein